MRLKVENYRGIERAELSLSPQITLIGAANHAGKSSLMQAMGAALLGAPVPVDGVTANRAGVLVRVGADDGFVELETDQGTRRIDWPSCKINTDAEGPGPYAHELVATGGNDLNDLDQKKRAEVVINLTKALPTEDDLRAELEKQKIPQDRIDSECAMVFGLTEKGKVVKAAKGWEASAKAAEETGRTLKAKFSALTGITWGSKQGGTWLPAVWDEDLPGASEERLQAEVTQAKELLESAIAVGAISSHEREQLAAQAETVTGLLEQCEKFKAAIKEAEQAVKDEEAKKPENAHTPTDLQTVYNCHACNAELVIKGNKAVPPDQSKPTAAELKASQKAMAEWQAAVKAKRDARDEASRAYHRAQDKAMVASSAQDKLARLGDVNRDDAAIEAARESVRRAEQRLDAVLRKTEADKLHEAILTNDRVIDTLRADGLRQRKLATALSDLNLRLAELSNFAGWKPVELSRELKITYGGRAFGLLSQSEQFRANSVLRVAFAQLTQSHFVLLDAADVLDVKGRNGLFRLVQAGGVPAVVAMTSPLNQLPDLQKAGKGVTYWLEGGKAHSLSSVLAGAV